MDNPPVGKMFKATYALVRDANGQWAIEGDADAILHVMEAVLNYTNTALREAYAKLDELEKAGAAHA